MHRSPMSRANVPTLMRSTTHYEGALDIMPKAKEVLTARVVARDSLFGKDAHSLSLSAPSQGEYRRTAIDMPESLRSVPL